MTEKRPKRHKAKELVQKNEQLITGFTPFQMIECKKCHKFLKQKRWLQVPFEKELLRQITKSIQITEGTHITDIDYDIDEHDPQTIHIFISGTKEENTLHEEATLSYTHQIQVCPHCSRNNGQYFQGILRLRNCTEEILTFLDEQVKQVAEKGWFITKKIHTKDSYDFYMTENKMVTTFGQLLQKTFGGMIKKDAKLQSYNHQESKELFRTTVTVFFFRFQKGQLIQDTDTHIFHITGIQNHILAQNIKTQQKIQIHYEDEDKYTVLSQAKTRIIQTKPDIYVLHPTTYQETILHTFEKHKFKPNQEITVYYTDNEVFYS